MLKFFKAFIIMLRIHIKQVDKGGKPYFLHPIIVCKNVKLRESKVVALLHDVIEDSDMDINSLSFLSTEEINALRLLTHNEKDNYLNYINKILESEIAIDVKIADLKHNMNLNRLGTISANDIERIEKYLKALRILVS